MQGRVITISRQCGSGGHSIGNELAKTLNVPFYDKEIIEMTAKESGFHPQFVEEKGEHMESSMLSNLARHLSYAGRGNYEDYQPLQDQLYFSQAKIIKELAEKGPCVIVGRCADYILRDRKDKLRADHYRYYTDQKWGDSFHYHLCLDSSMFGIEKCVDMIEDACKAMCPPS